MKIEMKEIPLRQGSPEIRREAILMPVPPYIVVPQHSSWKPNGSEWFMALNVAETKAKIVNEIPNYYWGCEIYGRVGDKSEMVAYWYDTT